MSTPSSLSQSLARLQSAPHEVLTNLPAQIASGRSAVDVRLVNLALASSIADPIPAHIKIRSAVTLKEIPIETETLIKLGEILQSSNDPYTICAALSAIHNDNAVDLSGCDDVSVSLQHDILNLLCSKDARICQHAILAFSRLHRYKHGCAVTALDRISKLLQTSDLPFQTRILLLELLSKIHPDSDAISLCFQQIDAAMSDRSMEDSLRDRIITIAVQAILQRQCELSSDSLNALLARNLHLYILKCRCPIDASPLVSALSDYIISGDPARCRVALRFLLKTTDSVPSTLLDQVRWLLGHNCNVPLCISVLSRHCSSNELQTIIGEVLQSPTTVIDKFILVHVNALVRKMSSRSVTRFFIERLVGRLQQPNSSSRDLMICLAFCLRDVESIEERIAYDLAKFCHDVSGVPARLVARVCLLAASRSKPIAKQFYSIVQNLFESRSSSFGRYLICIECLTFGRVKGNALTSRVLASFLAISPNWVYWILALGYLAETQTGKKNLCHAIEKLHSVRQCISSINLPGKDTAFQLEYLQLRIEFLETFGSCRTCPPSPEQRAALQQFAARFSRLTCITTSLSIETKRYLKWMAEMCPKISLLETLIDSLRFTTPPGFFTLYSSDLVSSRAVLSETSQLTITVRLRSALKNTIRSVSAVYQEQHVPMEFRNGSYYGEMQVQDSTGQVIIVGVDQPGQQYQLGSVIFNRT